ncbi:MAG: histidine triad nucleotide-binding protein [Deltaproteobacteria bacterium]|nr:histidine triad nucleotide-binding protein [Deltaproteobacteria bacterium]
MLLLSCLAHAEERVDAAADYDTNNVFARILRGELPADIVFESEYALAFHDISPKARVHVLVIPKGPYTNILQFNQNASSEEKLGLLDAISQTARIMGVDESGFRLVSNTGRDGGQTVPHLHFHLIGGEHL